MCSVWAGCARALRGIGLLGLVLASLPCAAGTDSLAALPVAASAHGRPADARRQGALFRISRDGRWSYLFGTIHVGNKSMYPLAPEVGTALADSRQLVLELDTRAEGDFQRALAAHASYRDGQQIGQHVAPATLVRLRAALAAAGVDFGSVAHLKPWLLANYLMGLELQRSGYDRNHGLEAFLLEDARRRGTAVAELESADYQLSLYDTLDTAEAERYLSEVLDELASGTALRKSRAMIDAWTSGDAAALDALFPDATAAATVMSDFTRRVLLDRRNPEMAARIERYIKEGKTSFVGVGLLHLLGANGLPRLLAQRGYQVERMY